MSFGGAKQLLTVVDVDKATYRCESCAFTTPVDVAGGGEALDNDADVDSPPDATVFDEIEAQARNRAIDSGQLSLGLVACPKCGKRARAATRMAVAHAALPAFAHAAWIGGVVGFAAHLINGGPSVTAIVVGAAVFAVALPIAWRGMYAVRLGKAAREVLFTQR